MSDTTATAEKLTYEEQAQLGMNEAQLRQELKRVMHERTMLAEAIFDCGTRTGILRKDIEGMTGPELLMVVKDLGDTLLDSTAQLAELQERMEGDSGARIYQVFLNYDGDPEEVDELDETLEIAWVEGNLHEIRSLVKGTGAMVLDDELEMPPGDVNYRIPADAGTLLEKISKASQRLVQAPSRGI